MRAKETRLRWGTLESSERNRCGTQAGGARDHGGIAARRLSRAHCRNARIRGARLDFPRYRCGDAARPRARCADHPMGLLHGLPIAVKDLFDTFDMPIPVRVADLRQASSRLGRRTRRACAEQRARSSSARRSRRSSRRSTPGRRAIRETCSTRREARRQAPQPRSPTGWFRSPFGSQTAGSIVRPAAFCGVVGYKPTFGPVTRVGVKMISDTLDTIGVLGPQRARCRTVRGCAHRPARAPDRTSAAADVPRIGLCRTYEWNRAQPETVAMFEERWRSGCVPPARAFGT